MPMISQETISRIKEQVPVSAVLQWLDVRVVGRNKAFCPLCADKDSRHPGMSFDDANGMWYCFVHAGGGDIFDLVRGYYGITFSEAVERVASQFGIEIKYDDAEAQATHSDNARYYSALRDAQAIFVSQRKSASFKRFVSERHLSEEAIDRFGLGMSNAKWSRQAVDRLLENHDADTLVGCGLCYRNDDGSLSLRYRDRVTYPIRIASGTIVGFGGRDITGKAKGKYVNSPETPIFHKRDVLYGIDTARREMSRNGYAIVCEGYMDTIALQEQGYPAIGAMGTALTTENLRYLSRCVSTLYLSLDADQAGRQATARTISHIPEGYEPSVLVVMLPHDVAKDPDEYFNQKDGTKEGYQRLLDDAVPLFLFGAMASVHDELEPDMTYQRRQSIEDKVSSFVRENVKKMRQPDMEGIADWLITTTGMATSRDALISSWLRTPQKAPRQAQKDIKETGKSRQLTRTEMLIYCAYTRFDDTSDALIEAMDTPEYADAIDMMWTNETKAKLFYGIMGCGNDHSPLMSLLDDGERSELTRIVTLGDEYDAKKTKAFVNLAVKKAIALALSRTLNKMTQSEDHDFSKLISTRQAIARLNSEINQG